MLGPPGSALEVRPVAQEDRLEALDQQVDVAEGVEVLAQGLGQRRTHAVETIHGPQQRQVALRDHDLLGGGRDVGAQGVRVEGYGRSLHDDVHDTLAAAMA